MSILRSFPYLWFIISFTAEFDWCHTFFHFQSPYFRCWKWKFVMITLCIPLTYIRLMFFWPCIMNWLYIDYQLDTLIIIHSQNIIFLYMFQASSAHLQEDTIVYMQHMVLSLSMRLHGGLSVHSLSENWLEGEGCWWVS